MSSTTQLNIEKLKKSPKLALLLGMFAGDGCLSIKHNGQGYRCYPINFYNTNKKYVKLFSDLFLELFQTEGKTRFRQRTNKKDLWEFEKYSVKLYNIFNNEFEIANGKKALNVSIPSFILNGNKELKKNFFLGLLITDGGIRKERDIIFHLASKNLIQDLKTLITDVWGFDRKIKKYTQKDKYISYQLTLNRKESFKILSDAEVAQSGTAQINLL
jgi:hypothetical protein